MPCDIKCGALCLYQIKKLEFSTIELASLYWIATSIIEFEAANRLEPRMAQRASQAALCLRVLIMPMRE